MLGRKSPLDVVQGLFLMDIDQHFSVRDLGQSPMLDLARLEDDIAVRSGSRSEPRLRSRFSTSRRSG